MSNNTIVPIPSEVYVQTDGAGYIIAVNSDSFINATDGWVKIDEGYTDKYAHAQGNYFALPLFDGEGNPNYRLVNGEVQETGGAK